MEQALDSRDPLTGVNTRLMFRPLLAETIDRARSRGDSCALLFFDLDNFKSVNDAFGHMRGDEVLIEVARRVSANIRSTDSLFRYGGDEFVVLLRQASPNQAVLLAERLLDRVRAELFAGSPPLSLSLSIGVASLLDLPDVKCDPDDLFSIADRRLNQAKRAGKSRVVADDFIPPMPSTLTSLSRMIERDAQMDTVQHFLEALGHRRRGLLQVKAAPGMGVTRFLDEVQTSARMRGFRVLVVQGSPALRGRVYGALAESLQAQRGPLFSNGASQLETLWEYAAEPGSRGLLAVLDDVNAIDRLTLDAISDLLQDSELPVAGIVYATAGAETPGWLPQDVSLRARVELPPLSPVGMRTWLRHALQWEAPEELVSWLYRETLGRPGNIQRGLSYLLSAHKLVVQGSGWTFPPDLTTLPLLERLTDRASHNRGNLPEYSMEFVGREQEVWQLKSLVRRERLVTLVGPGGAGKSRLAIQAAAELRPSFSDGVFLVELTAAQSASMVYYAVARALGIPLFQGADVKQQALTSLRNANALLIIDDFESFVPEAALLEEILDVSPQLHLLVTSRVRLRLANEAVFDLGGLPLPPEGRGADLRHNGGVRLFEHAAQNVYPGFTIHDVDLPSVGQICRLMEGLPLGIRLAATWVRTRTCAEIAADLETRLISLTGDQTGLRQDGSDLPERQQRLSAVIGSFWQSLSPVEQEVLQSLSIFRGPFHEDAAREIAGASPFFLDSLVLKGYLSWLGQRRYRLHEVLRQYAADHLSARPDALALARDRQAAYYARLAGSFTRRLRAEHDAVDAFSIDLGNIRAAWEWAVLMRKVTWLDQMLWAFSTFCTLRSLPAEAEAAAGLAIRHLTGQVAADQIAIQHFTGRSDVADLANQYIIGQAGLQEYALHGIGGPDLTGVTSRPLDHLLGGLHLMRANALFYQDLLVEAQQAAEEARPYVARAADDALTAMADFLLGSIVWMKGDYAPARACMDRTVELARKAGRLDLEAEGYRRLCQIVDLQGDFPAARAHGEHALALSREAGDRVGEVMNLLEMGLLLTTLNEYPAAREYLENSLVLARAMRLPGAEGLTLLSLGSLSLALGRITLAEAYLNQSLRFLGLASDKVNTAYALVDLGRCTALLGGFSRAGELMEQALGLYRGVGNQDAQSVALAELGCLEYYQERPLDALTRLEEALTVTRDTGYRLQESRVRELQGQALAALARWPEAEAACRDSLEINASLPGQPSGWTAQAVLSRALLAQDRPDEARQLAAPVLDWLLTRAVDGRADYAEISLACWQVFQAVDAPRAAEALQAGLSILAERAGWISAEMQRAAYLEQIAPHRRLLETARQAGVPFPTVTGQ